MAFFLVALGRARRAVAMGGPPGGRGRVAAGDRSLLSRPLAAAVLLATLVDGWIHPTAPAAWRNLLDILSLLALLRLLPKMLSRRLGPAIYLIVVLFILQHTLTLVPEDLPLFRVVLLGLSALGMASLLWLARRLSAVKDPEHPTWSSTIILACRTGAVLMAVAVVGNIVGNVSGADVLTAGLMTSVFTALLVWVGAVVVRGAEAVILRTEVARRLNMVRDNAASIRSVTGKLVRVRRDRAVGVVTRWPASGSWSRSPGSLASCSGQDPVSVTSSSRRWASSRRWLSRLVISSSPASSASCSKPMSCRESSCLAAFPPRSPRSPPTSS